MRLPTQGLIPVPPDKPAPCAAYFVNCEPSSPALDRMAPACTYTMVRCIEFRGCTTFAKIPLSLPYPDGEEGFLIPLPSREGLGEGDFGANLNALHHGPANFTG
jgi:hypothetical protein